MKHLVIERKDGSVEIKKNVCEQSQDYELAKLGHELGLHHLHERDVPTFRAALIAKRLVDNNTKTTFVISGGLVDE